MSYVVMSPPQVVVVVACAAAVCRPTAQISPFGPSRAAPAANRRPSRPIGQAITTCGSPARTARRNVVASAAVTSRRGAPGASVDDQRPQLRARERRPDQLAEQTAVAGRRLGVRHPRSGDQPPSRNRAWKDPQPAGGLPGSRSRSSRGTRGAGSRKSASRRPSRRPASPAAARRAVRVPPRHRPEERRPRGARRAGCGRARERAPVRSARASATAPGVAAAECRCDHAGRVSLVGDSRHAGEACVEDDRLVRDRFAHQGFAVDQHERSVRCGRWSAVAPPLRGASARRHSPGSSENSVLSTRPPSGRGIERTTPSRLKPARSTTRSDALFPTFT